MVAQMSYSSLDEMIAAIKHQHEPVMVAKYRLLSLLGRGSMATVFHARDLVLKRPVALKVFPQRFRQGDRSAELEQFVREARSAARVEHINIVRIYDIDLYRGWFFIAMELIEGSNLEQIIKASGPIDYPRSCQLIADAADALATAHRLGVVHRDIKPGNLMLTRAGRCKVTDFGLAALSDPDDQFRLHTESVGTPYYIAPEVARGQPATPRSDIYSLTATTWHLLIGQPPYTGSTQREILLKHVREELPEMRKLRPDLPDGLIQVIQRGLAKRPEDRFHDADEFASAIRAFRVVLGESALMEGDLAALADAASPPKSNAEKPYRKLSSKSSAKNPRTRSGNSQNVIVLAVLAVLVITAGIAIGLGAFYVLKPSGHTTTPQAVRSAPATQPKTMTPSSPSTQNTITPPKPAPTAPPYAPQSTTPPRTLIAALPIQNDEIQQYTNPSPASPVSDHLPPATKPEPHDAPADKPREAEPVAVDPLDKPQPSELPTGVADVLKPEETQRMFQIIGQDDTRTYAIWGKVSGAKTSSTGKSFRIHLNEQTQSGSFYGVCFPDMYADMAQKFGGQNGEGLVGHDVILVGKLSSYHGSPQVIVNSVNQIILRSSSTKSDE